MKYRTLTAVALAAALVVGFVAQAAVYAVMAPSSTTDFVATVVFLGGFIGGLLGFVGIFRVRAGLPFFNKPF